MANRRITFKIKLGDDLRRWTSEEASLTYAEVLNRAGSLFSTPVEDTLLRYQDDDGDWVTLACEEDLKEAIAISTVMSTTDKVVVRLDVASPKPTTGSAAAFAEESSKKVQELEETVYRLEKEAKKATKHAEKMAEKMEKHSKDAAKEAKKATKEAAKQAEQAACQLKNKLQTDFAPVLAAGLEQMVTALTPRDGHPHEAAMAAMQDLVAQLATPREAEPVVHPGVTCDVSGMSPIVGIRYKKKGCNYDLCEAEYAKLSDAEKQAFMRIDSPQAKWRVHHRSCRHAQSPAAKGSKPQARFVEDVNIPENTEILPGTAFTKIWRLRNTGTEPWPVDTKLIQIGGDKFEGDSIADVAPAPAGEEVDVAVSLVAPNMPGRYVSYWRLAEPPSMRKFGQRIWVQVVIVNPDGSVEFEASESEQPIHPGVECDISGQCPIVGVRYHKKGDDYDLCEAEFNQLDEASKGLFERIDRPGAAPIDMAPPTDVVVDELEERHGWSAASIKAVTNSKLVETMEVLQKSLPPALFDQAARTLEPLFVVPEQCLGQVLQHLEPMVAALAHEPGMLERINATVQGLIADPEKLTAELAEYQDASPFVDMLHLVGKYECRAYPEEDKNDWHYVRLAASEDGAHLIWQNAAGAAWPLYPTEDKLSYRVGEECPYYNFDGGLYHTTMALQIDAHGDVLHLVGPHGEVYERLAEEATFTPPSLPVEGAEVFPTDEVPLPEPATLPEPTTEPITPAGGSMTAALADLGIAQADLSASMLVDLETFVTESEEASEKKATEEARAQAEAEAAELVTEVEEAAAKIGPDRVEVQPCSMADAIAAMGVGEDALSASMLMEIENVVNANAEQAEQTAIEASKKEEDEKKAAEEAAAAEAAAAEAAAEAARIAEQEAAAAKAAEEEALARLAAEAEAAEAARIAAEEAAAAKAAAEEAAAKAAAAEAAAAAEKAAALEQQQQETDPALVGLVSQLVDMGFDEPTAATALDATNGNVEQAIMLLLSDPPAAPAPPAAEETDGNLTEDSTEYPPAWNTDWDSLLEELEEMGFSDPEANRAVLSDASGDVKDAVKELVSRERTTRNKN